ncbi:MaoC/PaaZ C-terminal domain-containing protein [Falsiroseomonas tokyonensis]|uniref:MaoC/PaaZ C-terminal domain-containing protein n=1 Tax=Falsiroseomonas tokyonensis TaxID=430521 RepID=A0ABV7BTG7_9PROT|nr:MaoC/PaaZ C-terminal domain-containing protein [Falsiroseomonas tokyonensis]MBU8537745.1 dehydratase [Falsiroseomonas tokyonensis]
MTPLRSADDLAPGQSFDLGGFVLPRAEVLDFAARWDPQPFHLDEEAARHSVFGRLVASGLHTYSAAVGHLIRSGLLAEINLAGGGVELSWPAPLEPDESVTMRLEVAEMRVSRSKPEMAVAKLRYLVATTAEGRVVLDALGTHFLKR